MVFFWTNNVRDYGAGSGHFHPQRLDWGCVGVGPGPDGRRRRLPGHRDGVGQGLDDQTIPLCLESKPRSDRSMEDDTCRHEDSIHGPDPTRCVHNRRYDTLIYLCGTRPTCTTRDVVSVTLEHMERHV